MRNIPPRAWILALVSSGLQILVFPKLNLYFLAWVAMAPLLYALLRGRGGEGELFDSEGRSLRPFTLWQGFLIAWVSGIVWYLGTCYWIYPGDERLWQAALARGRADHAGILLYMGLHHGVFGVLVVLMARRSTFGNRRPLLLAPVFWMAIEFFRDRMTGVPWNPLGGSQVDNIPFARIAQTTGVYGLSFAVMLVNCAFVAALLLMRPAPQEPADLRCGCGHRAANRDICQARTVCRHTAGRAGAGKRSVAGPAGVDATLL